MFDLPQSQADGLLRIAHGPGPRLLGAVSHGDERAELPLLWRLCSAMVELGHPVVVLDGTQMESAANPGLEQWLDFGGRHGPPAPARPDWVVVPAALGLAQLGQAALSDARGLQPLQRLLDGNTVAVLYAGAQTLVKLCCDTGLQPLLAVSGDPNSSLTAYLALKRLLLTARLEPTILHMMALPRDGQNAGSGAAARQLEQCAKRFLGYDVNAIHLDPQADDAAMHRAVRLLATRMVDTALPLAALGRTALCAPRSAPALWAGGSH